MLLGAHRSGVETCILQLARALAQHGTHDYVVYVPRDFPAMHPADKRLRLCRAAISGRFQPLRILWEQFVLPVRLRRDGADVVHAPGYIAPLAAAIPVIVTMYDLIALQFPQWCRMGNRLHYGVTLPLSARKACLIIVPSTATRTALIQRLRVPEDRIRVIPPGIGACFSARGDAGAEANILAKHQLRQPYILFVGNLEPKKNIAGLIRAFHLLHTTGHAALQLVIAGRLGWDCAPLFRLVKELGLAREIIFTGFVSDDVLPVLYRRADLFIFPSWYEGFGLPPLEAMASGVPAIVSNRGALPESAGDAALAVEPDDMPALAQAMRAVLEQRDLRDRLIGRGLERARQFTWRRAAEATEHVYEEAQSMR